MLFRLAIRNIARQKRRTALTLSILAAGFLALALSGGFMSQSFQGLADGAIKNGLGHVQILHPAALEQDEGQSLEFSLAEGEVLAQTLRQDPAVLDVLPRIQFMGLLSNGPKSVAFLGTGVDVMREPRYMACLDQLKEGGQKGSRWLNTGSREAILGTGLAKSLGVAVGDSLTLMTTTREGALNAVDVEVAGVQDLGVKELNDRSLTVSLETAGGLLNAGPARSRLSVILKKPEQAGQEARRLQSLIGGQGQVRPWYELASFYKQVKMLYFAIFGFMGLVLGMIVLLATANTLLMSVMERVRELGTLRALGLKPRQMLVLLQWEGATLGFFGSLLGFATTLVLRFTLNAMHIQLPAPPGISHGYELNIQWVPSVYLASALILQTVIQLSALFPGMKAARLRVTEALRHV